MVKHSMKILNISISYLLFSISSYFITLYMFQFYISVDDVSHISFHSHYI